MSTPAINAGNFAGPALQSILLCFLVIVIAMLAMAKPAQAEGDVNASKTYWGGSRATGYDCNGMASLDAIKNCELAWFSKLLADDRDQYVRWGVSNIASCPDPVLRDLGQTGNNVDRIEITHYRIAYNCAGFGFYCYYVTFCQLQPAQTYYIYTTPSCPANTTTPTPPCVCKTGYQPDTSRTQCVTEQYAISLHGLGVEVMPNKKLETAYALVTKRDGSAKSGAQVTLLYDFVPEEDSFNHADGQHIEPHRGSVSATSGSTDENGKFSFVFQAPEAGGTHIIVASCTNCTNTDSGTVTVPGCTVDDLTPLADLSAIAGESPEQKQLTLNLDSGLNGYSLLTPETQAAEQCLARRITTVAGPPSISGYKVTSTIRTYAYQEHLWEVWDKFWELKEKVANDPTIQQSCQTLITKVEGEMGMRLSGNPATSDCTLGCKHCIRYEPATDDPKHVATIAFDIPLNTVKKFKMALWLNQMIDSTVQQEANTCGLTWGGTFGSPDPIHFLLR